MGERVWEETQKALDHICTTAEGPHSYSCLNDLCKRRKNQAVVFSGLLPQPMYFFPLDESEPQPELPCIFLQEVLTFNPQAKTQYHLNVIIRPETIYQKKHLCQVCFGLVSVNSIHRFCSQRKTCFKCLRKKLHPTDWYDSLMEKKFCPSLMFPNHPSVKFVDAFCPKCNEKISTQCCLFRLVKNCNGQKKCKFCSKLIVARKGQSLEEQIKLHQCGVKKCLLCF